MLQTKHSTNVKIETLKQQKHSIYFTQATSQIRIRCRTKFRLHMRICTKEKVKKTSARNCPDCKHSSSMTWTATAGCTPCQRGDSYG